MNAYGELKFGNVGGELRDYIICFVRDLDPNCGAGDHPVWPEYEDSSSPMLLEFANKLITREPTIKNTTDNYRAKGIAYLADLMDKYPLGRRVPASAE
jgi:hypothetical protein